MKSYGKLSSQFYLVKQVIRVAQAEIIAPSSKRSFGLLERVRLGGIYLLNLGNGTQPIPALIAGPRKAFGQASSQRCNLQVVKILPSILRAFTGPQQENQAIRTSCEKYALAEG